MKQIIKALFVILIFPTVLFSQVKKEVDNGLFVTFPNEPQYSATETSSTYATKTDNCIFAVLLQRNAIPNYAQYLLAKKKWTKTQIKTLEDSFLDNAVKGKLDYTGNTGNAQPITIGGYNGRKIEYSAINPSTGIRGKRYSVILLIRDKLINFEVWYTSDNSTSQIEKNEFLNSITTN